MWLFKFQSQQHVFGSIYFGALPIFFVDLKDTHVVEFPLISHNLIESATQMARRSRW